MIRKAEKNQLEYRAEYDFASYDEFIAIYKKTMERLDADDFYYFDEEHYMLVGEHTKKTYKLGQRVKVRLDNADKMLRTIEFGLVDEHETSAFDSDR